MEIMKVENGKEEKCKKEKNKGGDFNGESKK